MDVKKLATEMKAAIEETKAKGADWIKCENIIAYLDLVLNPPQPELTLVDLERYKAELQDWVEENKHQRDREVEMFRSVGAAGQNAIKSSLLLNGGAAFALLAFIANLARFRLDKVPEFAACLLWFTFGALAIVVTSGLAYLSEWIAILTYRRVALWLNVLCIVLGIASYGLFTWGILATYSAFISYK